MKRTEFFQKFQNYRLLLVSLLGLFSLGVFFELIGVLLKFAPEPIGSRAELFQEGSRLTLLLALSSGGLGIGVGLILSLAKLEGHWTIKAISSTLISVIRGTPLLVQIFFVYYALPALIPALKFNEFKAALIALSLNVGAYNAEAIRAGILAVPNGQLEAARSLGLSQFQALRWVVLPQAFKIVIPPLMNNFVALLKDSSLVSSIGLLELTLVGNRVTSETYLPVPVLTTVACIYFAWTTILSTLVYWFKRFSNVQRNPRVQ